MKLDAFIEKVSTDRLRKNWHNKDELKYLVAQSIAYAKKTSPAIGYVRANLGNVEDLLKQINELRIENNTLKAKLAETENEVIQIPDIADIDESYNFSGSYRIDSSQKIECYVSETWLSIFIQLAPSSLEGIDDTITMNLLNKFLAKKNNYKYFFIDKKSFDTIKIQMIALGLFDSDGCWQLTEKGKKILLMNSAVRTNKK